MNETSIEIEHIREDHIALFDDFDCGEKSMNDYLTVFAKEEHDASEGRTTLVVDTEENKIISYFTLKCSSLRVTTDNGIQHTLPAVEIARFAVDKDYQGNGIGKSIFAYIVNHILEDIRQIVGVRVITLFAIPKENVIAFYKKMDFFEADESDNIEVLMSYECQGCKFMYAVL